MLVHCCHCRWCQRETGASFALNAMIEADRIVLVAGAPEMVDNDRDRKGAKGEAVNGARAASWARGMGGPVTGAQ